MAYNEPDMEKTLATLQGEVEALRTMVANIACQLPEAAQLLIKEAAKRSIFDSANQAKQRQTDPARDFAAGMYGVLDPLCEDITDSVSDLRNGGRWRTVQPAKLSAEFKAQLGLD